VSARARSVARWNTWSGDDHFLRSGPIRTLSWTLEEIFQRRSASLCLGENYSHWDVCGCAPRLSAFAAAQDFPPQVR